jgi:23S rRNA (cytosine1962-C5)-methyltransferase
VKPSVFPHPPFSGHDLLDSGEGEKLERFGEVILRRPDPQALWRRSLAGGEWDRSDLVFVRESDRGGKWVASPRARREVRGDDPSWTIPCRDVRLVLRPTAFKHVGIFPEQASNWEFIHSVGAILGSGARMLNLFGYTGAASLLAVRQGWEVTHVDASRASLGWMRENLAASELDPSSVRVILDDALTFARREVRRGSRYQAILLDPPHHGRGPKGERWQLEEGLAPLIECAAKLLDVSGVMVLSIYAVGYSPLALANLCSGIEGTEISVGELAIPEIGGAGRLLPAGFCARVSRGLEIL